MSKIKVYYSKLVCLAGLMEWDFLATQFQKLLQNCNKINNYVKIFYDKNP